jgi:uncharacterized protein (TIGR00297 family)
MERPAKAIPPGRDRLQSNRIVWTGLPVLCYLAISWILFSSPFSRHYMAPAGRYDDHLAMAFSFSAFFALAVWRLRAATPLASFTGGVICLLITIYTISGGGPYIFHSGLTPLLLLFILTFAATRLGKAKKDEAGLAESRQGRSAAQVIANLGVGAIFCSFWGGELLSAAGFWGEWVGDDSRRYFAILSLPTLAVLAEATADTVSSEIGQAFGGQPFLLTTFRRVAPGTDGAISLTGTFAGIAAAGLIAATGVPAMGMSGATCCVAFVAGVAGLFFDSILGATVERRGWIGNDLVNLTSTAFAAGVSLLAIRLIGDRNLARW